LGLWLESILGALEEEARVFQKNFDWSCRKQMNSLVKVEGSLMKWPILAEILCRSVIGEQTCNCIVPSSSFASSGGE
jgi:hypothetical protein